MISDINADNCSLNAGLFIANCLFKSQMCKLKENLTQAMIMNFFTDLPRAQNIVTCYALQPTSCFASQRSFLRKTNKGALNKILIH